MASKKATGYSNSPHGMHAGNTAHHVSRHVFSAADADGDVIALGCFGTHMTYLQTQLVTRSGLGAGVTVDIGYRGIESGVEDKTYFVAGQSLATATEVMMSTLRRLWEMPPVPCGGSDPTGNCVPKRGEIHEVIMTVHGTPAADACVDVVMYYEHNR